MTTEQKEHVDQLAEKFLSAMLQSVDWINNPPTLAQRCNAVDIAYQIAITFAQKEYGKKLL